MRTTQMGVLAVLSWVLLSCDAGVIPVVETFADADRPAFVATTDAVGEYQTLVPWNYGKYWNAGRRYPLVIGLHGSGGTSYIPGVFTSDSGLQTYPCFFLSPHCPSGYGGTTADWIASLIRGLEANNRIDTNRIYLVGFSMGGSGSYELANLLANQGIPVAGIVRSAGMSQSQLDPLIAARTSVWHHVGLSDSALIVQVAADTYANYKAAAGNSGASERAQTALVGGYSRQTFTLTKDKLAIFKKSEYTGLGHSDGPVYEDPAVLAWLFGQSLAHR